MWGGRKSRFGSRSSSSSSSYSGSSSSSSNSDLGAYEYEVRSDVDWRLTGRMPHHVYLDRVTSSSSGDTIRLTIYVSLGEGAQVQ